MKILGLLALITSLFLVGCGGGDGNGFTPTAALQVIHASGDAPSVDILANGLPVFTGVNFGEATGETQVAAGTYDVVVSARVPGGDVAVIGPVSLTLDADNEYTVVALGDVANIAPVVLTRSRDAIPAGSVRVQVVHGAFGVNAVDVYVTAPGVPLAGEAPVGSFSFTGVLGPLTIPSGAYQIRVTEAGMQNVVFDSGSLDLPSSGDLVVTAIHREGAGSAPIDLIVADGTSSSVVRDEATTAAVRVVHNSPDAPLVDIIVNDDFTNRLVTGLAFGQSTSFVTTPTSPFNVKVVETGTTTPVVIDETFDLQPGSEATVIASDLVAQISAFVYFDDRRDVATEARLRLIHGSPVAGPVDIYLVAPGAPITGVTPTLSNVLFGIESGYLAVAPGTYDVVITQTGSTTPAIGPAPITLDAAGVYTAIARDAQGGGLPLGLILLDSFLP